MITWTGFCSYELQRLEIRDGCDGLRLVFGHRISQLISAVPHSRESLLASPIPASTL